MISSSNITKNNSNSKKQTLKSKLSSSLREQKRNKKDAWSLFAAASRQRRKRNGPSKTISA